MGGQKARGVVRVVALNRGESVKGLMVSFLGERLWGNRRVQGSGVEFTLALRVQGSGFRVYGSWFMVQGSGFRLQVPGFRVQGSGFRVKISGFGVQGSGLRFKG